MPFTRYPYRYTAYGEGFKFPYIPLEYMRRTVRNALLLSTVFLLLLGVATAAPEVVDYSVEHVDGTEPDMDEIYVEIDQQDPYVFNIDLKTHEEVETDLRTEEYPLTTSFELASVGADASTTFEVEVVFDDFMPRFLIGAGDNMDWERDYHDDGQVTATFTAQPIEHQRMLGSHEIHDWPAGDDDRADWAIDRHVGVLISNAERQDGRFFKERVNGTVIGSDGMSIGTPDLRRDVAGNEQLVVPVAGPHYTVDGTRNDDGLYYTILPESTVEMWNVTEPDDLEAWYDGESADFTAEWLDDDRIIIEMTPSYSAIEVAVGQELLDVPLWQETLLTFWYQARTAFIAGILIILAVLSGIGISIRRRLS